MGSLAIVGPLDRISSTVLGSVCTWSGASVFASAYRTWGGDRTCDFYFTPHQQVNFARPSPGSSEHFPEWNMEFGMAHEPDGKGNPCYRLSKDGGRNVYGFV